MRFGRRRGYQTYTDRDGRTRDVHRRVMEKKLGGPIRRGLVVHHMNGDKDDNRPGNLVAIRPGVHGRLHGNYPDACLRCGRSGHWVQDCYARTDYSGAPL